MKKLGPGSDVDAWCTRCKMDLRHRIVAMEGERPVRVECLTCHGQHNYRRPASEESPAKAKTPRAAKAAAARPRVGGPRQQWENAIAGRTAAEFTSYNIAARFAPGQLVRHAKFGDGVVAEVLDAAKVSILFSDGPKTLVQGKT